MLKRLTLATAAVIAFEVIATTYGAEANRVVYVSVVNKNGAPVTDIQPADLEVKEAGKTMNIVSVKPDTSRLRIAVIDSDAGYGAFQAGIQAFMQKLVKRAEFSLISVLPQPLKVNDYSSDPAVLIKAIQSVGPRGQMRGGQLMEAIQESAKTVRAEGKRSILVAMRVGGEGTTTLQSKDVREEIRKSGATLYVMTVKSAKASTSFSPTTPIKEQQQFHDDEDAQSANHLEVVLGDGSRESGGHYEEIVSVQMAKAMVSLADEINARYEVVYGAPDGKPSDKLAVSTKRKNVHLYSPNHPN